MFSYIKSISHKQQIRSNFPMKVKFSCLLDTFCFAEDLANEKAPECVLYQDAVNDNVKCPIYTEKLNANCHRVQVPSIVLKEKIQVTQRYNDFQKLFCPIKHYGMTLRKKHHERNRLEMIKQCIILSGCTILLLVVHCINPRLFVPCDVNHNLTQLIYQIYTISSHFSSFETVRYFLKLDDRVTSPAHAGKTIQNL